MKRAISTMLMLLASGCADDDEVGSPGDPNSPPVVSKQPDRFAQQPGWPAAVRRTTLEGAYRNAVDEIVTDPARDRAYVVSRSWSGPGATAVFSLTACDLHGNVAWSATNVPGLGERLQTPGASIGAIAVHPDGSLSVLELRPISPVVGRVIGGQVISSMHFWRLGPEGTVLREVAFSPVHSADELRLCQPVKGTYQCLPAPDDVGDKTTYGMSSWVQSPSNRLVAVGDDLLFSRAQGAHFLYHLDARFQVRASQLVFPRSHDSWWYQPLLVRDGKGRIAVTISADQPMLDILAAAGGPALRMPKPDDSGVLVQYFAGDTLARIDARILAVGSSSSAGALAADGDQVIAVLNAQFARGTQENNVRERDIVVVRVTPGDAPLDYQVIDVADDDAASAAIVAADGRLWIGGKTNFVQVDTNSVVKDGEGLLLTLEPAGTFTRSIRLPGPRDVGVTAIASDGARGLLIGGTLDGPITHTCDDDPDERKACYDKGFFGHVQSD